MSNKRLKHSTGSPAKRQKIQPESDDTDMDSGIYEEDEGQVGIIESVSLKNFMCHSRFDIRFCSNTNIITGRNGSGKSAILTAVVVGLGGKANVTNRGSSVKGFIKSGKRSAEVTIKLKNLGVDAYKPELYGKYIIVERKMTLDNSSYTLKSETGNTISNKKEELSLMMDHFNIQVDNPVCILNQDVSRNFLRSKSPKDKYKLFLKASQLEQLKDEYSHTNEDKKVAHVLLEQRRKNIPELEKEVKEWEAKWRLHQSLENLHVKKERLNNELAWTQIAELEEDLQNHVETYEKEKNRSPKFMKKLQESKDKHEAMVQKYKETEEELKTYLDSIKNLKREGDELKSMINSEDNSYRNAVGKFRNKSNEIQSVTKDREELLKKIDELRNSVQVNNDKEKQERFKKIKHLATEKNEKDKERKTHEHHLNQIKSHLSRLTEDLDNIRREKQELHSQMERKSKDLNNLESSRTNHLRRFGPRIPELLKKIDESFRNGIFIKKPRGPLGACIKLKEPNWALAVEACLQSVLLSFCCDNHKDERELERLMNMTLGNSRKPSIVVSKFQEKVHNVSAFAVQCTEYSSVLNMLVIDDPVVSNCLIDQRGIESILLIADFNEAFQLMMYRVPKNCREAYTLMGDRIFPAPNFRYYSCNRNRSEYLQSSVEDNIRSIQDDVTIIRSKLGENHHRLRALNEEVDRNKRELHSAEGVVAKVRYKLNQLNKSLMELQNIEEPEPVDVRTLEEDVEQMAAYLKQLDDEKKACKQEMEKNKITIQEITGKIKVVDSERNKVMELMSPLNDDLTKAETERERNKRYINHYEKEKKEHSNLVDNLQKKYEAMKSYVEESVNKALKVCPRMETRRKVATVESEIDQLIKQLKKHEKEQGSKEEVTRHYFSTKQKFETIKKDMLSLQRFLEKLDKVIKFRREQYRRFQKFISMRVRLIFVNILLQRNYTGELNIDHENEALHINVKPSQATKETEDLSSLSGGERSFSTVAFILALWDAVDSPFRILDEFDVFMDMVNRRVSVDLMLEKAREKSNFQYIFLTPLGTHVEPSSKVHIIKMKDPERNQGILPFQDNNRNRQGEEEEED